MRKVLFVLMFLLVSASAHADIIFIAGNQPQPDEENITFLAAETGTQVVGDTNVSDLPVVFTSSQVLSASASTISGADAPLTNFTVSVPGHTFGDFIFNMNLADETLAGQTPTISVVANDGTATFSPTLVFGQNFLTIVAANGETISSINFSSTPGISAANTLRISGLPTSAPEPATLALFGFGLAGFGARRWRQRTGAR